MKTAMKKLIDYMEENYHLTEESRYEFKKALEKENTTSCLGVVSSSASFEDAVNIFQSFKPVEVERHLRNEFYNFISKHFMLMGVDSWGATIYPLKKSYKFLRTS